MRPLPWLLLSFSLALNAWLLLSRPFTKAEPEPVFAARAAPPAAPQNTSPTAPPPNLSPAPDAGPIGHSSLGIGHSSGAKPAAGAVLSAYADLVSQNLQTPEQLADLGRVLARWAATDPKAAAAWLMSQPDDPRFDLPVSHVANHLVAAGDYENARAWAECVHTPEIRQAALENLLAEQYRHRRLTPEALATAAQQAGLPADRLRAILDYSRLD